MLVWCPHQQQQRQLLYSLCCDKRKKVIIEEDKTTNLDLMSTTKGEKNVYQWSHLLSSTLRKQKCVCYGAHSPIFRK